MNLASYASNPAKSKGRIFQESKSTSRNDFQRDRDRIIHSASFRRLQYKTQVFVNHEGDMFRSRLTHSLEVSQIARAIARSLNCHEDLCEAVALAHDLGHTPFGHAGQDALNHCMKDYGGFEHNLQSLRVVDVLEKKYANFNGLNLTFEVREGILKHCSKKNAKNLGELGQRFIHGHEPALEAQIVNFADEIAYIHHDIDDGFRSGILNFELLETNDFFNKASNEIKTQYINIAPDQLLNEILSAMMNLIISDLCAHSLKGIKQHNPQSSEEVRLLKPLIGFSEDMSNYFSELKRFSRKHLYEHPRVQEMGSQAKSVIQSLFHFFQEHYERIPLSYRSNEDQPQERVIADYIAGMTDRFANQLVKQYSLKT
jgi:dGTPase